MCLNALQARQRVQLETGREAVTGRAALTRSCSRLPPPSRAHRTRRTSCAAAVSSRCPTDITWSTSESPHCRLSSVSRIFTQCLHFIWCSNAGHRIWVWLWRCSQTYSYRLQTQTLVVSCFFFLLWPSENQNFSHSRPITTSVKVTNCSQDTSWILRHHAI